MMDQGKIEKWKEIFNQIRPELCNFALRYTQDPYFAEDAVGMSFEIMLKQDCNLTDASEISSLLKTIASRKAIDLARKRQRELPGSKMQIEPKLPIEKNSPEVTVSRKAESQYLHQKISGLPEKYGRILRLVYFEDFTLDEVAKICNIPMGTAQSRLYRGNNKLHKRLLEDEFVML